jgi:tRNA pseudouridine32 synthase / 23S rRNA pseudouridine746 synthase
VTQGGYNLECWAIPHNSLSELIPLQVLRFEPLTTWLPRLPPFAAEAAPTYLYRGRCPQTGGWQELPRTSLAEAVAKALMQQMASTGFTTGEGKMFGVLLVQDGLGQMGILKAFSGLLAGQAEVPGWVPPLLGRDRTTLEELRTLERLRSIQRELAQLKQMPVEKQIVDLQQAYAADMAQLYEAQQQRKQVRQQQRAHIQSGGAAPEATQEALRILDEASRQDKAERKQRHQQWQARLAPLQHSLQATESRRQRLRQQRRHLSQHLQHLMHESTTLSSFAGEGRSLLDIFPGGRPPTGTGECCAPKLLHYAATHKLKPLALAEFWWGPSPGAGGKQAGEFYGACEERCQPILGYLLSGLEPITKPDTLHLPLTLVYVDDHLLVVDKPSGLLSVPGTRRATQDSVLTRLLQQFPDLRQQTAVVHRLDQDTSGLLILARTSAAQRQLFYLFRQRQVHKVYEAVLVGSVPVEQGLIDLPLCPDWPNRPRQRVDPQNGKPAQTAFHVLSRAGTQTRIEFRPLTGRTHQLRLHSAHPQGLHAPIAGDSLYGDPATAPRLLLHARQLQLRHPNSGEWLLLTANSPF